MASIKNILFLFAILVSSTVTLAQGPNSNESRSDEGPPRPPHGHEIAQGSHSNESGSDEGPHTPPHGGRGHGNGSDEEPSAPRRFEFNFRAPKFHWPEFPGAGFFSSGSRQKRATDRRVIRCNYATEGGFRCTGCHTVRRCYPFGRGTESTCSGYFQYCNNGQCSRTKGSQCADTTSTSTSSTSTTDSSTSTTDSSTSSSTSSSSSSSSTTESSTSSSSSSSTSTTAAPQ